MYAALEEGKKSLCIFLDLSKAFDTVIIIRFDGKNGLKDTIQLKQMKL